MWIDLITYLAIGTYGVCFWAAYVSAQQLKQYRRLWVLLLAITCLLITTGVIHLVEVQTNRPHAGIHAVILLSTAIALSLWVYTLKHIQITLDETQKRLAVQAHHDDLTGLLRRGAWIDAAQHEVARSQRFAHPIALVEFDIDDFKSVNDRYGHAVGDHLLKTIAHICQAVCRPTDILGRIGGEEFILALPETTHAQASALGERLRILISQHKFHTGHSVIGTTISVGIAAQAMNPGDDPANHSTLEVLMRRSDLAMYRAKSAGKNCVR